MKKMVGNATKSFMDMVVSKELIKSAIKNGKLEVRDNLGTKKVVLVKKIEWGTQAVFTENHPNEGYTPYTAYLVTHHITSLTTMFPQLFTSIKNQGQEFH